MHIARCRRGEMAVGIPAHGLAGGAAAEGRGSGSRAPLCAVRADGLAPPCLCLARAGSDCAGAAGHGVAEARLAAGRLISYH